MGKIKRILGIAAIAGLLSSCSTTGPQRIGSRTNQASYNVIPAPQSVSTPQAEGFTLKNNTKIIYRAGNAKMKRNAEFLSEYIKTSTGKSLQIAANGAAVNAIELNLGLNSSNKEAYRLTVTKAGVTITGASEAGVFYGLQTLRKSLPVTKAANIMLPAVAINDAPRFAYRGMHLDVARHFVTLDSVKRYVDMLALHNMNRFHWHLTDDQGWRIEIKKHPKLTEIGSKRKETVIGRNSGKYDGKPYGGFYTQDEIKELVAYAEERNITVIPEIDMPGHMLAALTAYPELGCTGGPYDLWTIWGVSEDILCAGNEKTFSFVEDVLTEVMQLFPSKYIHVGGDEAPKVRWQKCPRCQARIKSLGLKSDAHHTAEERLQSYFIGRAEKFLNSHDRQIIGWDEILEGGLAPNATVMSWRGVAGGIEAAKQRHDVIMTPNTYMYFDYYQSSNIDKEPFGIGGYVPVLAVYNYEPLPAELTAEQKKHIIGVQANIWTEYMPTYSHIEYMAMPRAAALAEVQWTMPEKKNYKNFLKRMPKLAAIYNIEGYNYAKHIFNVDAAFVPNFNDHTLDVTFSTIDDSPVLYSLDGREPSHKYTGTLKIKNDAHLKARIARDAKNSDVLEQKIYFNKATIKPIKLNAPINKQYEYKGASTLVDGLRGENTYKSGKWIAFVNNNMDAVIDLLKPTEISSTQFQTCVLTGDWIFDARSFEVQVSDDGKNFRKVASEDYPPISDGHKSGIFEHKLTFPAVTARYVRVIASPERSMPSWHDGKGKGGYLFVDEILIN